MSLTPGRMDIRANRWTPLIFAFEMPGYDFSAAAFAQHVRLRRDTPGAALITLANAAAGTQGLSATVAFDDDGIPTTTVTIRIDEATIEALLPFPANGLPADEPDVSLVHDIHITPNGGIKARWVEGAFTIFAGATH